MCNGTLFRCRKIEANCANGTAFRCTSTQDRETAEIFKLYETIVSEMSADELKTLKNWQFNWLKESRYFPIFKLTTVAEPMVIQGLMSIEERKGFIYMSLLENAPFNIGKAKKYVGVAGNLVAFACKRSFERGDEGFVTFVSKSQLVKHYQETLGAKVIFARNMVIEKDAATKLVNNYFKNYFK